MEPLAAQYLRRVKIRFGIAAGFVTLILVGAAYAFYELGPVSWPAAAGALLMAILTVVFGGVAFSSPKRPLVALPEQRGIGVSNSPAVAWTLVSIVAACYLFVLSCLLIWLVSGEQPVSSDRWSGMLVITACVGTIALIIPVRRYRLGGLLITPDRVVYRSYTQEHSLAWADVKSVGLGPQRNLQLRGHDNQDLNIPWRMLRTPLGPLAEVLEFYRSSAGARPELGDARALDRFNQTATR